MRSSIAILILISYSIVCFIGCTTQGKLQGEASKTSVSMALPPVIVYKTRKDYNKNVAIQLSEDKKRITGYPHPYDVSEKSYPTPLKNGYMLDNRGIGKNTAFISMTYEEYAALRNVPSIAELDSMIIDRDPVEEMYNCENHAKDKDIINDLNKIIDKKFEGCQRIK
jgi:hypothetical protein